MLQACGHHGYCLRVCPSLPLVLSVSQAPAGSSSGQSQQTRCPLPLLSLSDEDNRPMPQSKLSAGTGLELEVHRPPSPSFPESLALPGTCTIHVVEGQPEPPPRGSRTCGRLELVREVRTPWRTGSGWTIVRWPGPGHPEPQSPAQDLHLRKDQRPFDPHTSGSQLGHQTEHPAIRSPVGAVGTQGAWLVF